MATQIVIGLFATLGDAEDVRHRLAYEGVPQSDIELKVLRKVEHRPESLAPKREESFIDWIFGTDLPEKYVTLVRNGETAVCVRAHSDEEAAIAANTMRQFAPLDVDTVRPEQEGEILRREQAAGSPGKTA
jgi:hypothetical protein